MWFLSIALAAPPTDAYPLVAEVALEPAGIQRIHLPPSLRAGGIPADHDSLLLLDANGMNVPFAVLEDGGRSTTVIPPGARSGRASLAMWPLDERDRYGFAIRDRPVHALSVRLPGRDWTVTARVTDTEGELVGEGLFWSLDGVAFGEIPMPARTGEFEVQLLASRAVGTPELIVHRELGARVPPEQVELELLEVGLQENGWTRWDVLMDHPLPLRELELQVTDDLFDRKAGVVDLQPDTLPGLLPAVRQPSATARIRQLDLGGSTLSQTRVPVDDVQGPIALYVEETPNLPPLELDGAIGHFPGVQLVVRDPGPGPHSLYAGSTRPGRGRYDLQFAAPELDEVAGRAIEPSAVRPNPDWTAPEHLGGLGRAGLALDLRGQRFSRTVTGQPGLVRIPLDTTVLGHARPDLGDLRLMDTDGEQLPYVLRNLGPRQSWGDLPFEREEKGSRSILRVRLPQADIEVGNLTLSSSAPVFSREIQVARPAGPRLDTLRYTTWSGDGTPSRLTLDVHQRVGEELVVIVENGDDPPLPIEGIEVRHGTWELLALLPEQGAELVYGDRTAGAPTYDFALLGDELPLRAHTVAELGPEQSLAPAPLRLLDRVMLGVGVLVMAIGLLGLTLLLLRAAPDETEDEPDVPDGSGEASEPDEGRSDASGPPPFTGPQVPPATPEG